MVNNMAKRISILLIISAILMPITVNATTNTTKQVEADESEIIQSVDELQDAIDSAYDDGVMTDDESSSIIEQSTPDVIEEYFIDKFEEASIAISNANVDVDEIIDNGSDGYGSMTIDMGDHTQVILEFEDYEEPSLIDSIKTSIIIPVYAATNGETLWKNYGNRYFTAKATVLSGIGGSTLILENHYKVSSNGLDERYGDAYVSTSFSAGVTGSVTPSSPIISDASARTPGKSNINLYARYQYNYTSLGYATSAGYYKIATAVDYVQKDATNKRIKVKHSWKLTNN